MNTQASKLLKVIIDIESLSTESNAAILTLGGFVIDCEEEAIQHETFYDKVSPEFYSNETVFDTSLTALQYWDKQDPDVRREAFSGTGDLETAMSGFAAWINQLKIFGEFTDVMVFGNGSSFDNVVLKHAMDVCNIQIPWTYRGDLCFRTIRKLHNNLLANYRPDLAAMNFSVDGNEVFHLIPHHALHDAIQEGLKLEHILASLRAEGLDIW